MANRQGRTKSSSNSLRSRSRCASADSHHSLSSDRSSAAQLVLTVTSTYSSMSPLASSSVLIDLVSVKDFLEDRLGRRVNVVTKEGLEPAIRKRVLREAKSVF
jgi:hypothetical protein